MSPIVIMTAIDKGAHHLLVNLILWHVQQQDLVRLVVLI